MISSTELTKIREQSSITIKDSARIPLNDAEFDWFLTELVKDSHPMPIRDDCNLRITNHSYLHYTGSPTIHLNGVHYVMQSIQSKTLEGLIWYLHNQIANHQTTFVYMISKVVNKHFAFKKISTVGGEVTSSESTIYILRTNIPQD